jgi:hypothetical protein
MTCASATAVIIAIPDGGELLHDPRTIRPAHAQATLI